MILNSLRTGRADAVIRPAIMLASAAVTVPGARLGELVSGSEWHADDRHVEVRRVAATGQAHERGDAAESGHLVAAQRLWLLVVVQGTSVVQASQSCTGPAGVAEAGRWQDADRHGS